MPIFTSKALGFLLLIMIQYLLLLCNPSKAEDPFYQFCENTASYRGNTTFQWNLEEVFSILTANAGTSPFLYREKGEDPDIAHALYLCRGDVTGEVCKKCIHEASQEITRRCPNRTSIIWYDSCMLHYSEKRIYSVYDPTDKSLKGFNTSNTENVTDPNGFNLVLDGLMAKLVRDATEIPWRPMFATGEVKFTSFQTIYGLVQCGQHLARDDCKNCLQHAISEIPSCCKMESKVGEF
ncbi:cysteine-rich repeat secretory protein 38-like [Magnolia sinica]|uniref:cysteine-rich repeat secretory protein 38-like n=1 Tax=Magnolia sinica TaxID=86752 RepID=UPI00265B45E1|nr:cysteine-rich repeat secretory protein 38-like [Magnolia sinica]